MTSPKRTDAQHTPPTHGRAVLLLIRALGLAILLAGAHTASQAEDLAESVPEAASRAQMALIIDDLGYSMDQVNQITTTPYSVTLAVIPYTPFGRKIAELAKRHDKEIMLHTPMETLDPRKWEAGLTTRMNQEEILSNLQQMLADIPHVKGINNHGGSKFTQDETRMTWVVDDLKSRELYFIDSFTIASSAGLAAARKADLSHGKRDVFLDNEVSLPEIRQQFQTLKKTALDQGKAIGIGHPYPETLSVLFEELPRLRKAGINLVYVSALIDAPARGAEIRQQGAITR